MAHHPRWFERTLEDVILPAFAPVAEVCAAGVDRCTCGHTPLGHATEGGSCRACDCSSFTPDLTTAT